MDDSCSVVSLSDEIESCISEDVLLCSSASDKRFSGKFPMANFPFQAADKEMNGSFSNLPRDSSIWDFPCLSERRSMTKRDEGSLLSVLPSCNSFTVGCPAFNTPTKTAKITRCGVPLISAETVAHYLEVYTCTRAIASHSDKPLLGHKHKTNGDVSTEYLIVDCRWPYEFQAGHIKGAINIYKQKGLLEYFFSESSKIHHDTHIIFHCEYSKMRSLAMYKVFTSHDFNNTCSSRRLGRSYSHVFVMDGGYNLFFQLFPSSCEPREYISEFHNAFAEEREIYASTCDVSSQFK